MIIKQEELDNWFTYHPPIAEQQTKYINIRRAAKFFAEIVLDNTPPSADQTDAIRKIREAVMTANASIACYHESVYPSNVKMMMGERVPNQSLMKDETK